MVAARCEQYAASTGPGETSWRAMCHADRGFEHTDVIAGAVAACGTNDDCAQSAAEMLQPMSLFLTAAVACPRSSTLTGNHRVRRYTSQNCTDGIL